MQAQHLRAHVHVKRLQQRSAFCGRVTLTTIRGRNGYYLEAYCLETAISATRHIHISVHDVDTVSQVLVHLLWETLASVRSTFVRIAATVATQELRVPGQSLSCSLLDRLAGVGLQKSGLTLVMPAGQSASSADPQLLQRRHR
eukprot:jgi/Ulvmu1/7740/UM039_0048.1